MRITESCAACLYDKQKSQTDNAEYLAEVKALIDHRSETDTSPYMVYLFEQLQRKYFGAGRDYRDTKREYNDLVLGMEEALREEIEKAGDPLAKALVIARVGNYIDFGAMHHVSREEFLSLFRDTEMREDDRQTYQSFLRECEKGKSFLLVCDNCGEIVLDKLMLEQLKKRFPTLQISAMVRGREVLNDATQEDAVYVGLDRVADIVSNGAAVAGTIYSMLSEDAKAALDGADVILSKGQGNYETLSDHGRHIFYELLCKCDHFMQKFGVPRLTGIFTEEIPEEAL